MEIGWIVIPLFKLENDKLNTGNFRLHLWKPHSKMIDKIKDFKKQ